MLSAYWLFPAIFPLDCFNLTQVHFPVVWNINHLFIFQAGDLILADKRFLLHGILPQGVLLNLPAFLSSKKQFTKAEAIFSRKIAKSRIHVERAIERLRNYKIIETISTNLKPFSTLLVRACSALANLQSPIISGVFNDGQPDDEETMLNPTIFIPLQTV